MSTRKLVAGTLAAAALTIGGGAAIAAAPDTTTSDRQSDATQDEKETQVQGSLKAPVDQNKQDEIAEGRDTSQSEAAEKQKEAQETQQLQGLAKVDRASAEQAALRAVPGTVKDAQLGNEDGYVIWEVEVVSANGGAREVKVDAGNGQVLAQEAEDNGGSEQGQENEASEGPEANETSEAAGN